MASNVSNSQILGLLEQVKHGLSRLESTITSVDKETDDSLGHARQLGATISADDNKAGLYQVSSDKIGRLVYQLITVNHDIVISISQPNFVLTVKQLLASLHLQELLTTKFLFEMAGQQIEISVTAHGDYSVYLSSSVNNSDCRVLGLDEVGIVQPIRISNVLGDEYFAEVWIALGFTLQGFKLQAYRVRAVRLCNVPDNLDAFEKVFPFRVRVADELHPLIDRALRRSIDIGQAIGISTALSSMGLKSDFSQISIRENVILLGNITTPLIGSKDVPVPNRIESPWDADISLNPETLIPKFKLEIYSLAATNNVPIDPVDISISDRQYIAPIVSRNVRRFEIEFSNIFGSFTAKVKITVVVSFTLAISLDVRARNQIWTTISVTSGPSISVDVNADPNIPIVTDYVEDKIEDNVKNEVEQQVNKLIDRITGRGIKIATLPVRQLQLSLSNNSLSLLLLR